MPRIALRGSIYLYLYQAGQLVPRYLYREGMLASYISQMAERSTIASSLYIYMSFPEVAVHVDEDPSSYREIRSVETATRPSDR